MVGEICLVVHEDELGLCKDAGLSMVASLWQLLPEELLERILLFVPASSQARLRCVCKRWSQLVTSSAFRKECDLIAFRRGHRNFLCCRLELQARVGAPPLHKVDLPGATTSLPGLDINSPSIKMFCGAGLVGVAHIRESDGGSLVCWLINMANKTCRRLPRLLLNIDHMQEFESCEWRIWVEPAPESSSNTTSSGFQVVFTVVYYYSEPLSMWFVSIDDSSNASLYTDSGTSSSTGWRTVHRCCHPKLWNCVATQGGFLGWDLCSDLARMSWDSGCITQLPEPPLLISEDLHVISDPGSGAVLGYEVNRYPDSPWLTLYRLDESRSSTPGWTWLYSGLPPQFGYDTEIGETNVTFFANMLVIVVCSTTYYADHDGSTRRRSSWHGLAYHMEEGSCKWLRLPAQAFVEKWRDTRRSTTVLLEPTLVSQLKL